MNLITNISNIFPIRPAAPATNVPSAPSVPQRSAPAQDTVEFSPLGRAMARAAAESTMRLAQINAIRSEIQNGTYESTERINATVSRLLESLR